jgi:lipoprotein-anchoring transpeptidase ErfK/SrfK
MKIKWRRWMASLRHVILTHTASEAPFYRSEGSGVREGHRRLPGAKLTQWQFALVLVAVLFSLPSPLWSQHPRSRHPAQRDGKPKNKDRSESPPDVSRINDSNLTDAVGPHSEGEAVVRAAILLDRLKFSPGEISSRYNDNLAKAIAAFQSASGLRALGLVDPPTWAALNYDQAKGHVELIKTQLGQKQQPSNQQQKPAPQAQSQSQFGPGQGAAQSAKPQGNGGSNQSKAPLEQAKGQNSSQDHGGSQQKAQTQSPSQPTQPPSGTSQGVPPQAVVAYTITMEDVSGPFTHLPRVRGRDSGERLMLEEAKLPRLNYGSSLELLAEKFHAGPRLLVQLNPGKRFDKEGEHIEVPNVLTPAPPKAASVVVDASTHSIAALDSNGQVLAFYPATVGSEHDPLPVGNWTIAEVTWHPKFKYNPNLFWDAEDKRPRATLAPGPKNPVGVVWIGLSKKHYGIHGTPQPSQIGRTQSHGCIRLTNWDAAELANMVQAGTPAILEEGTPSEVKSQPSSSQ